MSSLLRKLLVVDRALKEGNGLRRRRVRKIPVQRYPRAVQLQYWRFLRNLLNDFELLTFRVLEPSLPYFARSVASARGERYDGPEDDIARLMQALSVALAGLRITQKAEEASYKAAVQTADFNKKQINRQFQALLGIDLIRSEPYLDAQIKAFISDNVALIKSIQASKLSEIERLLYNSVRSGARVETIQAEIRQRYRVSKSKAALVARDQIGKFNGELTQLRQKYAGVAEYIWDTSKDERVRAGHRALHGKRFKWSKPPIVDTKTGRRAHPGQDYQCRCSPIPVLPADLFDEAA